MSPFLVFFLVFGFHHSATVMSRNSTVNDPVCDRIRAGTLSADGKFPVRGIGLMTTGLFLVTDDLLLYQLPISLVDGKHQVNLTAAGPPVPFCKRWSVVCYSMNGTQKQARHIFSAVQGTNNFLVLFSEKSGAQVNSIFDISSEQLFNGANFINSSNGDLHTAWVSSSNISSANETYRVQHPIHGSGTLGLANVSLPLLSQNPWLLSGGLFHAVCRRVDDDSGGPVRVLIKGTVDCDANRGEAPVAWPVVAGFVANGYFYLLATDLKVYIIPHSLFLQSGVISTLTIVPLKKFFICPEASKEAASAKVTVHMPDHPKHDNQTATRHRRTRRKLARTALIIGIVLLSIIAIAICCILIFVKIPNRPPVDKGGDKSRAKHVSIENENGQNESDILKGTLKGNELPGKVAKGKVIANGSRSKSKKSKSRTAKNAGSRKRQLTGDSPSKATHQTHTAVSSRRNRASTSRTVRKQNRLWPKGFPKSPSTSRKSMKRAKCQ